MAKTQKVSVKLPPVTTEDKEKDRITQKKKEPKHDPSESKGPTFKFFNTSNHKNIRKALPKALNVIANKYNVEHIDLENNPSYPDDFFARDWSWRSDFFMEYLKNYEDTIDYDFYPHYRSWLDHLINYCSIMIWNLTIKTMKAEHKKTGVVPKSPLSKKKGRDSIEAVAEYYASKEVTEFEEMFK